jgi:hypothetical protein
VKKIFSTADGRDVYGSVVGCALPAGTGIQATIPGAPDTNSDTPDTSYALSNGQPFSPRLDWGVRW